MLIIITRDRDPNTPGHAIIVAHTLSRLGSSNQADVQDQLDQPKCHRNQSKLWNLEASSCWGKCSVLAILNMYEHNYSYDAELIYTVYMDE